MIGRLVPWFLVSILIVCVPATYAQSSDAGETINIGIIGLDTSHAIAFTKTLNASPPTKGLEGLRVVAAYPKGSPDIESSVTRVPRYTEEIQTLGVEIVGSIEELLTRVDAVLLETNDGRPHLEQVLPVLRARKPVFIDKPIAGSLTDAVAIFMAAKKYDTPVFSSSSLRFVSGAQAARQRELGEIVGCDTFSPCPLEPTHPDLYWYGIHGVEILFTVMGPGCQSVKRISTPSTDVVIGLWEGGRIGTFRGIRSPGKSGYGGTAFGSKKNASVGTYEGYKPLVMTIAGFFRSGEVPVASDETLEIYAFMTAADESKKQDGTTVSIESVLRKAKTDAVRRLSELGVKGL